MYFKLAVVFALSALISACSSGAGIGELVPLAGADTASKPSSSDSNDSDDHLRIRHVMELRQRYRGSSDAAGLDELRRGETEAATHFLAAGSALAREGRYEEAIEKYEMGLLAQSQNAELQQARQTAAGRKELARLYSEGQRAKAVGNYDLAETLYQRAASFDGHDEGLKKELTDLDRLKKGEDQRYVLAGLSLAKIRSPSIFATRSSKRCCRRSASPTI